MNRWSEESELELDNTVCIDEKQNNNYNNNKFVSDNNNKFIDETYINYKNKNVTLRKWRIRIV